MKRGLYRLGALALALALCLALALALALCLALAGCQAKMTSFDASGYVSGVLDGTFKGTWTNAYLELVELTEGEAKDTYQAALEQEYQRFCHQFDIQDASLTDETRQGITDFLTGLCAKAQYTVQSAAALDDSRYAVEVRVRPMDLFLQVRADDLQDYVKSFEASHADADLTAMDAAGQAAFWDTYENAWAQGILELCQNKLGLLGYGDVETILVLIAPDSDGLYGMGDNDFSNLSALVLPY